VEELNRRREEVLGRLRGILIEKLRVRRDPDEIDPDTPLFGTGLRLDSVDAVELWVNVRVAFGLPVPEGERRITAMRTLNTLATLVLEMQGEGGNGSR
jgi:acyl carrier protein